MSHSEYPKSIDARVLTHEQVAALEAQLHELDAYSGAVAHELKAPLGNVLAYADDLRANIGDMPAEQIDQYLDMILIQSRRMNTLIDELLFLARVKMSEQIEITQIEMEPLVSALLEQLSAEIRASNAKISLPEKWHNAYGYSPWVERIWYNYLTNGLKYGGIPPQLTLGSNRAADGHVRFWIADQGTGLSAEQQADLFRPFPEIARHGPRSNGLGLSIVKRIAERLNGYVGVESEVGMGSKFYFALPDVIV